MNPFCGIHCHESNVLPFSGDGECLIGMWVGLSEHLQDLALLSLMTVTISAALVAANTYPPIFKSQSLYRERFMFILVPIFSCTSLKMNTFFTLVDQTFLKVNGWGEF